jgi:glutamate carboxypeptidase
MMDALNFFMGLSYHSLVRLVSLHEEAPCDEPHECAMLHTMIDRIRAALMDREAAMLMQIERLVGVNSFTENREGGKRVGAMLAELLGEIPGVSLRVIPSDRYAPHLVAASAAAVSSSEGAIAIIGHLDTVFPPGTFEGFHRQGDVARGPGVLDMKGGLVVAIEALRALAEVGVLDRLPVRFVIVSDEEVGSPEGQPILRREVAGAACALTLEAGRQADRVITARKGTGLAKVVAKGRAAHAGNAHQQGANAIWALARFIDRAQAITDYERGVTVNVGKVSGGQSKNTVPDEAEAQVDFRFIRIADAEATFAALVAAGYAAAASVSGTCITVDGGPARMPLERTEDNVALYREYAACARAFGLGDGEAPLLGGGSDASTTAAMGIPSIDGLGPRGSGFHTKEEMIEVSSLVPKAEALAAVLLGRAPRA